MSRRIDVELTSQNDDGIWTWRAAGAKQPKGTLDGSLLYSGASVGDVCRADADFEIDGIFITAVLPPKGRSGRPDDERIELLGSSTEFQGVTTQLAKKGRSGKKRNDRRRNDGKERKPKGAGRERDDKGRKGSRDAKPRKPKADAPSKPKPKPHHRTNHLPHTQVVQAAGVHHHDNYSGANHIHVQTSCDC